MRDRRRRLFLSVTVLFASVAGIHGAGMYPADAEAPGRKALTGGWSQDGSYVWGGTARTAGVHHAFDATMTFDWPEAPGNVFVGHSVARVHVLLNADGTGTVEGVEMFTGAVDGRRGQTIFGVEATVTNFTDYAGTLECLGGAGGLRDLTCQGSFVGKTNLDGYFTEGSYGFTG